MVAFFASEEGAAWREAATDPRKGPSIEEAFAAFIDARAADAGDSRWGDAPTRDDARCAAVIAALAANPTPRFRVPTWVHRAGRGHFVIHRDGAGRPTLHAAVDGRVIRGVVTERLRARLLGEAPPEADAVDAALVALGLAGVTPDASSRPA